MTRKSGSQLVSIDDVNQLARVETGPLPDPALDPGALPDDDDLETPDSALAEVLAGLGEVEQQAANCMVYRLVNGTEEYLYKCTAAEFASSGGLELIRQKYGGGDFRIRVYKGGKIFTHKRVKIGAPLVPENQPMKEIDALRAEVRGSIDRIGQVLERLAAPKQEKSLMEQLRELKELQTIISPPQTPQGTGSIISQLKDVKDLMVLLRDFGGGESDGKRSPLWGIAERYAPQILDAVKNLAPVPAGGVAQPAPALANDVQAVTGESVTDTARVAPQGEQDMNKLQQTKLIFALNFLCDRATQQNDPVTYAEMACDMVPVESLRVLLDRDDWIKQLTGFVPKVGEHLKWFTELRAEIFDVLRGKGIKLAVDGAPSVIVAADTPQGATASGVSDNG